MFLWYFVNYEYDIFKILCEYIYYYSLEIENQIKYNNIIQILLKL